MSAPGEIDVRDLAELVALMRDRDGAGAVEIAGANVAFALWNSLGKEETDPDLSKEEAREVLDELPVSLEEERNGL